FETVNLAAVEVRVIQVYENNMLQYLQNYNLDPNYEPDLRPVGKRVAYKRIDLASQGEANTSFWKAHALDLSKLIEVEPGSLYRVELSFTKQHSTYDCGEPTAELAESRDSDHPDADTETL